VLVCAVPGPAWSDEIGEPGSVARFAHDALTAERRIGKGVAEEDERQRYTALCGRLEREVLDSPRLEIVDSPGVFATSLANDRLPAIFVGVDYLDLLASPGAEHLGDRIGHTFVPPTSVPAHLATFRRLCETHGSELGGDLATRTGFLECAVAAGCGIVEAQDPYGATGTAGSVLRGDGGPDPTGNPEKSAGISAATLTIDDLDQALGFASHRKREQVSRLSATIVAAVRDNAPVSLSNRANDVIVEVLHRFVYVAPGAPDAAADMRIVYADGSEAEPFPIRCLEEPEEVDAANLAGKPIRAVLMSMRHDDLDREVEVAWFRNRDVSQTRWLAETDAFCERTTRAMIADGVREGPLILHLYHTGFEPAVIGFYRAVIRSIMEGLPLAVRPMYYRGPHSFEWGSWWL
jgi:hypothetical protein